MPVYVNDEPATTLSKLFPLPKSVYSVKKEFAPKGANSFFLEWTFSRMEAKEC